ncbi:hypothetical protein [Sphingopyxis sp.]|jgi:hypothetical protein|uniref:hypothetical protein n=1 Tax=Sphingopyxis sp. TaxID=1908224 RepID=UPI002DF0977A|nr:hypothetical protein [Sphingopyxis sp.]
MNRTMLSTALMLAVCSCSEFEESPALNPAPIYGCYVAPEAPSITITSVGVTIGGISETAPFHYEFSKAGAILRMPFAARVRDGQYSFERSSDHLFQIIHTATGPTILIAFGPDGWIKKYRRSSSNECAP